MDIKKPEREGSRRYRVTEGAWKGWYGSVGDPFNDQAGPFYHREQPGEAVRCAMVVEARHLNGGGSMHGGAMMTFADYCMYVFAGALAEGAAVTITLHGDYLRSVPLGAVLECTGEITRRTRNMVFVRGLMTANDLPVFSFSGVMKMAAIHSTN